MTSTAVCVQRFSVVTSRVFLGPRSMAPTSMGLRTDSYVVRFVTRCAEVLQWGKGWGLGGGRGGVGVGGRGVRGGVAGRGVTRRGML